MKPSYLDIYLSRSWSDPIQTYFCGHLTADILVKTNTGHTVLSVSTRARKYLFVGLVLMKPSLLAMVVVLLVIATGAVMKL